MAEAIWGWEVFFGHIQSFLERSSREMDVARKEYSDHVVEGLQQCLRSLTYARDTLSPPYRVHLTGSEISLVEEDLLLVRELLDVLRSLLSKWQLHIDQLSARPDYSYQGPFVCVSRRGRGTPRFDISKDQLEYLSSLHFYWTAISSILGVSRMTIYRRRQELDMLEDPVEEINEDDLCSVLREMCNNFPAMGEVMALGQLRSMGYKVKRDNVRAATRATDPPNTALCGLRGITRRRPYSVPGPNSQWHIGMNLIRCIQLL